MPREKKNKKRLMCPECSSTNFYTNLNERVCRRCGHKANKEDFVFEVVKKET